MAEQEAGWHNDPYGRFQQRYFDGAKWTEHVATGGDQKVDPLGASSVIPIATPATAFPSGSGGKGGGVMKFLDAAGPDSRERPIPSLRAAVAGLGGAVLALGVLAVVLGDKATRPKEIIVSILILAAAWANRTYVKVSEVRAAAVGMAVVAIPVLAISLTTGDWSSSKVTGFVLAALFIAAWAFPGFKSRNLLLALGALTLVGAFGSLASSTNSTFLPVGVSDTVGDEGSIYLIGGALYLGLTLWLDRRGHRGTGTAFAAAGLVSTLVGTGMLVDDFSETWAPLFVLAVGLVVAFVGSQGGRRATTWWGAVLTAVATVWFVAVQWEPGSTVAIGGVLLVSGIALIVIPLVDDPIRAALRANKSGKATSETPPPPAAST